MLQVDVISYWQIAILFFSWAVVATGLAVFLLWENYYKPIAKSDIEAQAIREHFADEEKAKHLTVIK